MNRVALLEWLRNNVSVDLLAEKDLIIKNLFEEKGSKYIYRQELPENRFSLKENASHKATKRFCQNSRAIGMNYTKMWPFSMPSMAFWTQMN